MGSVELSDISITPLSRISADGGDVMHALKRSDISVVYTHKNIINFKIQRFVIFKITVNSMKMAD